MSSNEEYLDNLLKSMNDGDKKPEKDSNAIMTPDEIEAMFAAAEKAAGGDSVPENDTTEVNTVEKYNTSANSTVDSTKDMSTEEIEKLLQESEQGDELEADDSKEESENPDKAVEDDLDALLQNLGQNDDLNEINELLKKADNNEPVADNVDTDINDSNDLEEADLETSLNENGDEAVPETDIRGQKKIQKKEKRVKKDRTQKKEPKETQGDGVKKKGIFGKLFSILTTEEDADEGTTGENQAIMAQLAAEDLEEANKKKKIKKGKMLGKASAKEDTDEDADVSKAAKKKEKKPKKSTKPKKEKAPKIVKVEPEERPSKKISKKSIFIVLLFSASVFGALLFGIYLGSTMIQKSSAVRAFENKDYITCYEQLYGMKLTEDQANMFHHAEVVLKVQRRIDMYEKYLDDDKELEALDSLMQAVDSYEALYIKAQSYGAADEVTNLYNKVLQILDEKYSLSELDARAIADCGSNVEYTRYLTALVGGETVSSEEDTEGILLPKQELEDVLPAEEEIIEPEFAD